MNVNKSVIENFFLISKKFPLRLALNVDNINYTYDQLCNSSLNIYYQINNEVKKDNIIAIDFKRSFNQISSILACLIGRNSFIILDEKMSNDRKKFIIKKLKINILITDKKKLDFSHKKLKIIKIQKINTDRKLKKSILPIKDYSHQDNVYYIFTSGSTGEPKGLQITNQNITNFVNSCRKTFKILEFDRFILLPQLSFDLSVFPLWVSLLSGSSIHYPTGVDSLYPAEFIKNNKINIYCSVPSQVNVIDDYLKNSNYKSQSIKKSIFCGEPLYYSQVNIWKRYFPKSKIFNTYGPSETTCFNTSYEVKGIKKNLNSDIVSIGKPMLNNKITLDQGEILISGKQVSPGYIDAELTKKKFFYKKNISFYKTGDFAKKKNDNYYYLGRRDNQIKLMGHRIELGEIEHKISKIFKNRRVLVFFINNNIYAAIEERNKISNNKILRIKKDLPHYMMPKKILNFDKFPYNKNFKIDKRKISDAFKK